MDEIKKKKSVDISQFRDSLITYEVRNRFSFFSLLTFNFSSEKY
jgi:hypothetical protein